jgi:hypothetical protein
MPENRASFTPLWGCPRIARFIGRSDDATYRLLEDGKIPGRKVGKLWQSTEEELTAHLTGDAA